METQTRKPRYILIDDDPTYTSIMRRVAEIEGVELDAYRSLAELGYVGLLGRYDVAIVDYELDNMTGVEIAQYLCTLFQIPALLVSNKDRLATQSDWPQSIKGFVNKAEGFDMVLRAARQQVKEGAH